ncbi:MAG: ribosomal-processing cysteine protease Prp [Paenibacillus sp.]|uniref:Ribosomal processing cysteine protease Prp n=1 Tax=Paenibacillus aquistagni TaxID=1852522 RepID=A0A1X7LWG8_9BACL|nr:ribosomal-processing cysteine protease Prp [Paenibacillus aquistagni]MBR2569828.1 ribosomal-processing cysteine protease Prp [Paenibacillus sp.]NMM52208.1 ribosomal-processing cysteine protease Prp [Paenibacillus aquistagni]SMG58050.1 hypothetical protein SAMN06295960_4589 [Paenibacillus aquistagni]
MIRVTITRNPDGLIDSFTIRGHAGFAPHGEDIVCAGVSAVTVGAVNAIEALTGVSLDSKVKDGFLNGFVPRLQDTRQIEQVQLLLESMIVSLKTIEDSYGTYLQINERNK